MQRPTTHNGPARTAPRLRSSLHRIAALLVTGLVTTTSLVGCASAAPTIDPAPLPSPTTAVAALTAADVDGWLDDLIPAALQRTDIAGATVAVVHDGQILTTRGFGVADTGTGGSGPVPVDPERHLFRAGSVSKLFTATAVLQLVQTGELDLDTDVQTYLDFELPLGYDEPLTLRHLLTHTGGFEERISGLIGVDGIPADLRNSLSVDPPEQVYAPGTVPAYSNYGNALAGYIVQRVSGMRFEDYIARNVLARAGMVSSSFEQPPPPELAERMSTGYLDASSPAAPFEIIGAPPAGALSAPAPDMARFMLAQLGEPVGEPLLDAATLELMHRPALDADSLGTLAEAPRMALGFFDESRNGRLIIGHGGDTQYFHSALQIYPESGTGIYLSLNSTGAGGIVTHQLREEVLTGFTDRYFPATAPLSASTVDAATTARDAAAAVGTYDTSRSMHSNFLAVIGLFAPTRVTARDDGRLLFEPGPLAETPALYEEISPLVWREVGGHRVVAMRLGDDERVEAIVFDGAFSLLRVGFQRSPGFALPVLLASALVLVLTVLVAWPIGAIRRRRAGRPPLEGVGRTARVLSRVAVVAAVLGLTSFVVSLFAILSLDDVPAVTLRIAQVLLLLGLIGMLPAAAKLVGDLRRRAGWWRVGGSTLVLLALAGLGWFSVEFMLLAPSVSY